MLIKISSSTQVIHNAHLETAETAQKSKCPLPLLITSAGWKTAFTNWLTALAKHVITLHTVAISQTSQGPQSICRSRLGKSPKEIKSPLPHRERYMLTAKPATVHFIFSTTQQLSSCKYLPFYSLIENLTAYLIVLERINTLSFY